MSNNLHTIKCLIRQFSFGISECHMGFSYRKFGHFLQACYVYIVNSLVLSLISKSFNYIQLIA